MSSDSRTVRETHIRFRGQHREGVGSIYKEALPASTHTSGGELHERRDLEHHGNHHKLEPPAVCLGTRQRKLLLGISFGILWQCY